MCRGARPCATSSTLVNALRARPVRHSSVKQNACGVTTTLSSARIGLSAGVGSTSKTSSAAPAMQPTSASTFSRTAAGSGRRRP